MIKNYSFTVPANGAVRPKITGNYINLVSSSAPAVPLRVRAYNAESGQVADINMISGNSMHLGDYLRIEIENETGADINITMVLGDGGEFEVGSSSTFSLATNAGVVGLTPLTYTANQNLTIASNASRKELDLMANSTNTGLIHIGSTDATKGIPLSPGQSYTISALGAVETFGVTAGDKLFINEIV